MREYNMQKEFAGSISLDVKKKNKGIYELYHSVEKVREQEDLFNYESYLTARINQGKQITTY